MAGAALLAVLQQLTCAVTAMSDPPAPAAAIYDPFAKDDPFDLATRSGAAAHANISALLEKVRDGNVTTFTTFVCVLRERANEGKWDVAGISNILSFGTGTLFNDYHSITDADITTAFNAQENNRAIQNVKATFQYIKSSISGDIKDTIFSQHRNLPTNNGGFSHFKLVTTFSTVASVQLGNIYFLNITNFSPVDHAFNIPLINTKLINLFTLATTSTYHLLPSERINHTFNVYSKIFQPEIWAQWVRNKVDQFEERSITVCQDFMNSAVIKYNKIIGDNSQGNFGGAITTIQEDIVAMMSVNTTKRKKQNNYNEKNSKKDRKEKDPPPFFTHFKDSNGVKYKLGDTKIFNGVTFHFCNCPLHCNRLKWHTHTSKDCCTRNHWLKKEGKTGDALPPTGTGTALLGQKNDAYSSNSITETDARTNKSLLIEPPHTSSNIQVLLASAMSLAVDDNMKEMIADNLDASANI